jgi:hypothetical protein
MIDEFNHEELEACWRHAQAALEAAAKRVFGSPPQRESDQVRITFDWEAPQQARTPIVFQVHVSRLGQKSSIRCAIDLDRLQTDDLQTLHDFLAFPPKGYWLARSVAWLIDTSLRQHQPRWSAEHRCREVRELLLEAGKHNPL